MRFKVEAKEFLRNESGATAVEYTLLAAAMGLCLIPAMQVYGAGIDQVYGRIADLFNHPSVSF